jgi:exonuclease SbcD
MGQRLPIIATGHLTTVGASSSESVREIYVGSLDAFPTSAFPPADYMALGHIHQPQKVGGLEHIRYSGSPIALSFDEARQSKQMLLVDLGPEGLQAVTPLPVPCFQPMASVAGSLAALPDLMRAAAQAGSPARPVWLEVVVEQDDYLPDSATACRPWPTSCRWSCCACGASAARRWPAWPPPPASRCTRSAPPTSSSAAWRWKHWSPAWPRP